MLQPADFAKDLRSYLQVRAADAMYLFGALAPKLKVIALAVDTDPALRKALQETPAWGEFMALYEYAWLGVTPETGTPLEGDFFCDLFDYQPAVDLLGATVYKTYWLAAARTVLDGGQRYFSPEPGVPEGRLTVPEVTMLADMDIKSVRNAMNAKLVNPLVGDQQGKRTYININEARRWLSGRKGFIPTQSKSRQFRSETDAASIAVPRALAEQLDRTAKEAGLTVEQLIVRSLNKRRKSP